MTQHQLTALTRWRGGRGARKWTFTLNDVAVATGLTHRVVRAAMKAGEFSPTDLLSVARFILAKRGEQDHREAALLLAAGGDMSKAAAALGVSRSTLYRRARSSPR